MRARWAPAACACSPALPTWPRTAGRSRQRPWRSTPLLGFTQPEALNLWPLRGPHGDAWAATPDIAASSGETLRQLALQGTGIACLADFMTARDRERGDLVQLLARDTADVRQPISAVYYRNTQLASRIACFLDFLAARLAEPGH